MKHLPRSAGRSLFVAILFHLLLFFSIAEGNQISYDKGDRRDPFVALKKLASAGLTEGAPGEPTLDGIIYDPTGASYAVFAGEIFREGDEVAGANLIRIFPERVVLQRESQETVIWLHEEVPTGEPRIELGGQSENS